MCGESSSTSMPPRIRRSPPRRWNGSPRSTPSRKRPRPAARTPLRQPFRQPAVLARSNPRVRNSKCTASWKPGGSRRSRNNAGSANGSPRKPGGGSGNDSRSLHGNANASPKRREADNGNGSRKRRPASRRCANHANPRWTRSASSVLAGRATAAPTGRKRFPAERTEMDTSYARLRHTGATHPSSSQPSTR